MVLTATHSDGNSKGSRLKVDRYRQVIRMTRQRRSSIIANAAPNVTHYRARAEALVYDKRLAARAPVHVVVRRGLNRLPLSLCLYLAQELAN